MLNITYEDRVWHVQHLKFDKDKGLSDSPSFFYFCSFCAPALDSNTAECSPFCDLPGLNESPKRRDGRYLCLM